MKTARILSLVASLMMPVLFAFGQGTVLFNPATGAVTAPTNLVASTKSTNILDSTSAGRALLVAADAAAQRVLLAVVVGTDVQAYDIDLKNFAGIPWATGYFPYYDGTKITNFASTSAGRALLAAADAAAQRTLLDVPANADLISDAPTNSNTYGRGNSGGSGAWLVLTITNISGLQAALDNRQLTNGNLTKVGTLNAGDLTNLNASALASGTIPSGVLPGPLQDLNLGIGTGLIDIYAPNITLGTLLHSVLTTNLQKIDNLDAGSLTNVQYSAIIGAPQTHFLPPLWIDSGAMVPTSTNGAVPATSKVLGTDDMTSDVLDFDDTTSQSAFFKFNYPTNYAVGSLVARFVYRQTSATTGTNVMSIALGSAGNGDTIGSVLGTAVTVTNVVASATNTISVVTSGAITIGNSPAAGDIIVGRVSRLPADAYDNATGNLRLLGVSLVHQ